MIENILHMFHLFLFDYRLRQCDHYIQCDCYKNDRTCVTGKHELNAVNYLQTHSVSSQQGAAMAVMMGSGAQHGAWNDDQMQLLRFVHLFCLFFQFVHAQ